MPFGSLPPWEQDELPAPPPFTLRNLLHTIGPGAILLAASIGGGEWLVGPAVAVKHGTAMMWIATIGIVLQLLLNLEGIRYTLYTGEPIIIGIMRLRPGSRFWATGYALAAFAQLGIPALAAACAGVLFASFAGVLPADDTSDSAGVLLLTYAVIVVTVAILISGKKIERVLEVVSTFMVVFILSFLLIVNFLFVPFAHWLETISGFFEIGTVPPDVDVLMLATFAATAGSGGIGNLVITNWYRDKGMGMGSKVGSIASAFGSSQVQLSSVGKVFPVTEENLRRWRNWWRYVKVDQVWLWGLGCFVGMFLNVNLATAVIDPGVDMEGLAAGTIQAQYMAEKLWRGFWFLTLLNGFWILMSTQLGNTDTLIRTVTDIVWVASPKLRERTHMSVSKVYYSLLAVFTVWGLIAVNWGNAVTLFKILGGLASPIMAVSSIQILLVNTRLLPPELRPAMWRRAALVLCCACYGFLSVAMVQDLATKFRAWMNPPAESAQSAGDETPAYEPATFREKVTQLIADEKYLAAAKFLASAGAAIQAEHDRALQKTRIVLQLIVEPFLVRGEADEDSRGSSMPCNDDLLLLCEAEVAGQVVFQIGEWDFLHDFCSTLSASRSLRILSQSPRLLPPRR
jgi:hypothetical protein